ncbi:MAG: DUF4157 domain-containing protein [Kibdelosporangium sp.]
MASNQASDGKPSRGGRLRGLIPFLRRQSRPAVVPPQVATASLAVRPPWWRGAVQRMVGGLWPGFRSGQVNTGTDSSSAVSGAPGRPLVAQRRPLAGKASLVRVRREVKRAPLTASSTVTTPKSTVVNGLTPQLTMAPAPGAPSGAVQGQSGPGRLLTAQPASASAGQGQPDSAPLTVRPVHAPEHVVVQREAARLALANPPARSLAQSMPLTQQARQPEPGKAATRSAGRVLVRRSETAAHSHSHSGDQQVTPEQRWREAVARVPLEAPLPFPEHMRPLVAQLTGKTDGARYTTGSATRRALTEVGALGATTGSVVHLAQRPSMDPSSMGVLAHELTHARTPVARPRFMLHKHTGSMDSDERHARSVGSMFDGASLSPASQSVAPVRVQRFGLPSASGLVGGLRDQATSAAGSLGNQATGAVGGLRDRAESAIGDGASAVTSQVSSAAAGLSDRFTAAATGFGDRIANEASTVTAGLVDNLPVGGGTNGVIGAVSQMARTAVESAVREASQTTMAEANQAVSQVTQAAQSMASNLQSMATDGVSGMAGQASQWVNGAVNQATGAVQGLGDQAVGALGDAQNAVTSGVSGLAGQAMGAVGNALGPGASQALSGLDLDRLAEALEERLLRQLERRGGRYAGVF